MPETKDTQPSNRPVLVAEKQEVTPISADEKPTAISEVETLKLQVAYYQLENKKLNIELGKLQLQMAQQEVQLLTSKFEGDINNVNTKYNLDTEKDVIDLSSGRISYNVKEAKNG